VLSRQRQVLSQTITRRLGHLRSSSVILHPTHERGDNAAAMTAMDDDDDEYEIPLRDQRYFGAGLKRKRVRFVASSEQAQHIASLPALSKTPSSAADRYLAIVLGQSNTAERATSAPATTSEQPAAASKPTKESDTAVEDTVSDKIVPTAETSDLYCDICSCRIAAITSKAAHERSIAHQISLQHSYPPSHLDRGRKGLAVLRDHGWDPDSRLGLGAKGEGILQPIKAVENPHRAGVGAKLAPAPAKEKPVKLDAGKVRAMEQEGKKKAAKLRNSFYMSDDVQKHLGEM
jgi:hypothetical protein